MLSTWKKPVEVFISTNWKKNKVPAWRLHSHTVCPLPSSLQLPRFRPLSSLSDSSQTPMSPASCALISSPRYDPLPVGSVTDSCTASMAAPGCTSLSLHPFISQSFCSHNPHFCHTRPLAVFYTCSAFLDLFSIFLLSLLPGRPSLFLIFIHIL